MMADSIPRAIEWIGGPDGCIRLIDQTRLPETLTYIEARDVETVIEAIRRLRVRGAPAIGIAAAMGFVLGAREFVGTDRGAFFAHLDRVGERLASARPTAVNLVWALDRMRSVAESLKSAPITQIQQALLEEALRIREEDAAMCRAIGRHGASLIRDGCGILTHCNAGGLATAEYGTALAPIYEAHTGGRRFRVYACETRPLLQGSRLTAWELMRAGVDVTVVCDDMAAALMQERRVDLVLTGADRIAANGDTANKIGTYALAVLARHHGIPFYVAAPSSTFDLSLPDGSGIPIEMRGEEEVRRGFGRLTAPEGVRCWNPAFDVTPAGLISGILCESGLIRPVTRERIEVVLGAASASPLPGRSAGLQ